MVNLLLSLNNFDENWCYSILKNIIKDTTSVPSSKVRPKNLTI